MTRSPALLLRRLFREPPMLELPLGRLFRRAHVHAQYESGDLSGSDSVAIPGKQRAASWAALCNYYLKNESLSWLYAERLQYVVALHRGTAVQAVRFVVDWINYRRRRGALCDYGERTLVSAIVTRNWT